MHYDEDHIPIRRVFRRMKHHQEATHYCDYHKQNKNWDDDNCSFLPRTSRLNDCVEVVSPGCKAVWEKIPHEIVSLQSSGSFVAIMHARRVMGLAVTVIRHH